MIELVLASQSPRRAALLQQLGVEFRQQPADIDERQLSGEPVEDYVARLAWEKSAAVQAKLDDTTAVIAADTTVVLDGTVLGKPEDHFDALAMLARLSGREHQVLTAVCVRLGARVEEALSDSRVLFRSLTREQCEAYLLTDEPWDKAGAYGIQGLAGAFVETLQGSYTGIVGLPLAETWELLQRVGVTTGLESSGDDAGDDGE
ncbi:MAG: Maf family protein [Halieaceae bacterium]|nr:Maf family protein [Halieaceae bacterium]